MVKPLKWSVDWKHLKPTEMVMMWFPLVGTQKRVYADLIRQLNSRKSSDRSEWDTRPKEIRELESMVSRILIEYLGWPGHAIFLPDDPADIVFWDKTGDLAGVEAMVAVEKATGADMGDDFWNKLSEMTYSQVIQNMNGKRATGDENDIA